MISNKRLLYLNKINHESSIEKWFNYLINNNFKIKSEFDSNLIKKLIIVLEFSFLNEKILVPLPFEQWGGLHEMVLTIHGDLIKKVFYSFP